MLQKRDRAALSVEELVKEWLETGDDAILDVLKASDEDFINRSVAPWTVFKESYAAGRLCFHIHYRWQLAGRNGERYCLRAFSQVNGFENGVIAEELSSESVGENELCIPVIASRQQQGTMRISVSELIQNVEGIHVSRLWPSTVRLQPLNQCSGRGRNAFEHSGCVDVKLVAVGVNGKSASGTTGVILNRPDQGADQVVEGGTKNVQELTNFDAKSQRRVALLAPPHNPGCVRVWVGFQNESVVCRFYEAINVSIDDVELFVSPV